MLYIFSHHTDYYLKNMPRTKLQSNSKASQARLKECELFTDKFKKESSMRLQKMEREGEMLIKGLMSQIDIAMSRYPPHILSMTLSEYSLLSTGHTKETEEISKHNNPKTDKISNENKTQKCVQRTNNSDDGYATETTSTYMSQTSRSKKDKPTINVSPRRTRSSCSNDETPMDKVNRHLTTQKKKKVGNKVSVVSLDPFKTPCSKISNNNYGLITPKIKPNTPIHVLRRPKAGEMVLSMQGSPLLVSAVVQENMANINVPLSNGDLISLLPNHGLRLSNVPALDPESLAQLKILQSHLDRVIESN